MHPWASPGIKWYKWFGVLVDLGLACALTLLSSHWLSVFSPHIPLVIFLGLTLLLLAQLALLLVILLAGMGYSFSAGLQAVVLALAQPLARPHSPLRAALWGGGFIVASASAFAAWVQTGNWRLLFPGSGLLTLGLLSLARGAAMAWDPENRRRGEGTGQTAGATNGKEEEMRG